MVYKAGNGPGKPPGCPLGAGPGHGSRHRQRASWTETLCVGYRPVTAKLPLFFHIQGHRYPEFYPRA